MRNNLIVAAFIIGGGLLLYYLAFVDAGKEERQAREEYRSNRALWEESRPREYTFVYDYWCYCADNLGGAVRVTVRNGWTIDSIKYVSNGEQPTGMFAGPQFYTIDHLFDKVRSWSSRADEMSVEYDPEFGYPRRASVDYSLNTADDEAGFSAYGFAHK